MVATGKAHHHLSAALVLTLACSLPGASFIHQQCGFASPAAPRAAASLSRKSRFCNREVPPRRLRRRHATTTGAAAEAAVGLAIVIRFFQLKETVHIDEAAELKE